MVARSEHTTRTDPRDGRPFAAWRDQARAFAERYARELFRNKAVLFWSLAFPVGFYLLTITVFYKGADIPADVWPAVKAGTAVTYGMFGAVIASLNSFGQQLAMDLEADRYLQYRALPLSPSADLAGRMVAGLALSVVALLAVVGVAMGTGASFTLAEPVSVPVVLLAMTAFAVFWMVVAVLVATVVRDPRYASIITVSVAIGSYFMTGFNGGDPSMFNGPAWLLNWLPNSLPTRLVADHLVASPAGSAGATADGLAIPGTVFGLSVMAVYAAVALAVGLAVTRRVVYKRGVLP